MNKDKSSIFGSKNASAEIIHDLGDIFGVPTTSDTLQYLGHKLALRGRGNKIFDAVVEKVSSTLCSWRSRALSRVGHAMLIKSILQSIPLYTMSTDLFPLQVCDKLDSIVRKF